MNDEREKPAPATTIARAAKTAKRFTADAAPYCWNPDDSWPGGSG